MVLCPIERNPLPLPGRTSAMLSPAASVAGIMTRDRCFITLPGAFVIALLVSLSSGCAARTPSVSSTAPPAANEADDPDIALHHLIGAPEASADPRADYERSRAARGTAPLDEPADNATVAMSDADAADIRSLSGRQVERRGPHVISRQDIGRTTTTCISHTTSSGSRVCGTRDNWSLRARNIELRGDIERTSRDASDIRRTIRALNRQMWPCQDRKPSAVGTMRVHARVLASGVVALVRADGFDHPEVAPCLREQLKTLRFPGRHSVGLVTVSWEIVLADHRDRSNPP